MYVSEPKRLELTTAQASSTLYLIFATVANVLATLLLCISIVFQNFILLGVLVGLFFAWELASDYLYEGAVLVKEVYGVFAYSVNYLIDVANEFLYRFRPYIPAWNAYLYIDRFQRNLFFEVVDPPTLVALIMILIDAAFELLPTVILFLKAIIPVVLSVFPYILDAVNAFFLALVAPIMTLAGMTTVLGMLLDILLTFIRAIIPLLPSLVSLISLFIATAAQAFRVIFPVFLNVLLIILNLLLPVITSLIPEIATAITVASARIALVNIQGLSMIAAVVQFFAILFFAFFPVLVKLLISLLQSITKLIEESMPTINAAVVQLISAIPPLISDLMITLRSRAEGYTSINVMEIARFVVEANIQIVMMFISLIPILQSLLIKIINALFGVVSKLISALIDILFAPHSPVVFISIIHSIITLIIEQLAKVIKFWISFINVLISLIPSFVNLFNTMAQSGLLVKVYVLYFKLTIEWYKAILPPYIAFLVDVTTKILMPLLLEAIFDLIGSTIDAIVHIFVIIDGTLLVNLLFAFVNAIVGIIPSFIMLFLKVVQDFPLVVVGIIKAVAKLIVDLFVNNDFVLVVYDFIVAIIGGVLKLLFGFNFEILFDMIRMFILAIVPFFNLVIQFVNAGLTVNPLEGTSPPALLLQAVGHIGKFIELALNIIERLRPVILLFDQIMKVFVIVEPIVNFIIAPAAWAYENIVTPVLCPINVICCGFRNFEKCIFPGFGPCCCALRNGCPLKEPGCSCFG